MGGTFINSNRLSAAGKESKTVKINHGDILQLGVDYRPDMHTGQVRNKDRCVEARVEFPRLIKKKKKPPKWQPTLLTQTECCICLSALYMKQALFIAPCSHILHYRCIAPLLRGKNFTCPMCRQNADLHASLFNLDSDDEQAGDVDNSTDDDDDARINHPLHHGSHENNSSEASDVIHALPDIEPQEQPTRRVSIQEYHSSRSRATSIAGSSPRRSEENVHENGSSGEDVHDGGSDSDIQPLAVRMGMVNLDTAARNDTHLSVHLPPAFPTSAQQEQSRLADRNPASANSEADASTSSLSADSDWNAGRRETMVLDVNVFGKKRQDDI